MESVYWSFELRKELPRSSIESYERATKISNRLSKERKNVAAMLIRAYVMEKTICHSVLDSDFIGDPYLWHKKFEKASRFCVLKKKKNTDISSVCVI